jgi:hypothetical protein
MMDNSTMEEHLDTLILDLLEWLGPAPRPYAEVLDAWRTSCPRLPVWEAANEQGLIHHSHVPGEGPFISRSNAGEGRIQRCRRPGTTAVS